MPADWSRPVDVERLADAGECRENDLSLASLPRLAPDLALTDGTVHARIGFARERKQPVADIEVRARLPLRCQRCLQPVWLDVDQQSRVWLVTDLAKVDRDEMGLEPILAPEGHIALRDLIEEELLLAVPLVPRHEDESDCTTGSAESEEEEVVQRPFAGLGELLKRQ
ncbi:MAG: DUF177 domain-containing protein [Gammaproteobacteria bacterium]|jgi:uncharacterized protein|nr:DUF177 domain-containing protein [Gammaproteobacteria bacterium]